MSDLVANLRGEFPEEYAREAADEIESLREQLRLANIDACNLQAELAEKDELIGELKKAEDDLHKTIEKQIRWIQHACYIRDFSNCKECGMPMRPGCICEACGWDRSEVSDE